MKQRHAVDCETGNAVDCETGNAVDCETGNAANVGTNLKRGALQQMQV